MLLPAADPQKPLLDSLGAAGLNDPRFWQARELVAEHLARYALDVEGRPLCCASKGEPA